MSKKLKPIGVLTSKSKKLPNFSLPFSVNIDPNSSDWFVFKFNFNGYLDTQKFTINLNSSEEILIKVGYRININVFDMNAPFNINNTINLYKNSIKGDSLIVCEWNKKDCLNEYNMVVEIFNNNNTNALVTFNDIEWEDVL